ncbi:MAG: deacylase [Calditrichaeota bacterium]|nr:MAG: deacylase [Calditrichota bacterium]
MPKAIEAFLNEHAVAYEVIHHRRDYTAQETAADTHTPGKTFAKTVLVYADGRFYMTVLPATHQLDFEKLKTALGAKELRLASEAEIEKLCPDCEVGGMPPFGNYYNLPVYVSHLLQNNSQITFNAGTHEDVLRMSYTDFEDLVKPTVTDITVDKG